MRGSDGEIVEESERDETEVVTEVKSDTEVDPAQEEAPDGSRIKVGKVPRGPSREEYRSHQATHVPFRSWCPKCLAGRGHNSGHRSGEEPIDETPMCSLDYCFIRRGDKDDTCIPVVVMKLRRVGAIAAHVVPGKGASYDEVVKMLLADLLKFGIRGKLIMKGDQEPAIEKLLGEVARCRDLDGAETIVEFSPVRDSSSNGLAEKGVQTLEGLLRTHLIDLDEKLGERLALDLG